MARLFVLWSTATLYPFSPTSLAASDRKRSSKTIVALSRGPFPSRFDFVLFCNPRAMLRWRFVKICTSSFASRNISPRSIYACRSGFAGKRIKTVVAGADDRFTSVSRIFVRRPYAMRNFDSCFQVCTRRLPCWRTTSCKRPGSAVFTFRHWSSTEA